jgi:tRNA 2-selenouridine synthase
LENNTTECFRILLKYYDKYYLKALQMREGLGEILHPIKCESADAGLNVQKIEV